MPAMLIKAADSAAAAPSGNQVCPILVHQPPHCHLTCKACGPARLCTSTRCCRRAKEAACSLHPVHLQHYHCAVKPCACGVATCPSSWVCYPPRLVAAAAQSALLRVLKGKRRPCCSCAHTEDVPGCSPPHPGIDAPAHHHRSGARSEACSSRPVNKLVVPLPNALTARMAGLDAQNDATAGCLASCAH